MRLQIVDRCHRTGQTRTVADSAGDQREQNTEALSLRSREATWSRSARRRSCTSLHFTAVGQVKKSAGN